ncbi:MAG: glycosyltransferase [Alphaproteobacteria bacterium]|nr:glycosyltransferase [Alphaproteobacteria bacterium]MBU1562598.1 glycosyltransferase [Alphaproteobacteria bacterium]MBU2303240.1 glycosyltransferase [Alphaproteobacteria bacterium]MBU2370375.1 glycosyltransferase [Alphaproteobacteria bacterium]
MTGPIVTIAVPSYNQGQYLDAALTSIFDHSMPVEVFVLDGGSTDNTLAVIQKWAPRLSGWRSRPDNGQAASINEGIASGTAPFVSWLNSDDYYLPGALEKLLAALEVHPHSAVAYGRTFNLNQQSGKLRPAWVEPFDARRLAVRCIVSQPGTLIRRSAWEAVGGLDPALQMVMDYDLWWRLYLDFGPLCFVAEEVAVNRDHGATKTNTHRFRHYSEAIGIVRKHNGTVPIKWWLAQPYAVWYKTLMNKFGS